MTTVEYEREEQREQLCVSQITEIETFDSVSFKLSGISSMLQRFIAVGKTLRMRVYSRFEFDASLLGF